MVAKNGSLIIRLGETYTVSAGETETYETAEVNGTLSVDGTLSLTGAPPETKEPKIPMADSDSRYGRTRYAASTYGGDPATGYRGFETPWHISGIRVDGMEASQPLSPVAPGEDVTYVCYFYPQPNAGVRDDHIERFKALRDDLIFAPDNLIYDPPGSRAFFRAQHNGPSALLRVEPLDPDHSGAYVDGEPPPTREDSLHEGRWCVPTGGQPVASHEPDMAVLELETVTLASTAHYETREAALAALERSDFS